MSVLYARGQSDEGGVLIVYLGSLIMRAYF